MLMVAPNHSYKDHPAKDIYNFYVLQLHTRIEMAVGLMVMP
jgi:hypothetical protein